MLKKIILFIVIILALGIVAYASYYYKNRDIIRPPVGNQNPLDDKIKNISVKKGDVINSPLQITGEARGSWYFEASFPIKLYDSRGLLVVTAVAQADGEWMTTDFVPFKAILYFDGKNIQGPGKLVLEKDNPSGLPENDLQLDIPVVIGKGTGNLSSCKPTGCSGQICSDKDVVSTCEYRPEYACYKQAVCERQLNGQCGWTETSEYNSCIQKL